MHNSNISRRLGLLTTIAIIPICRLVEFALEVLVLDNLPDTIQGPIAYATVILIVWISAVLLIWRLHGPKNLLRVRNLRSYLIKHKWRLYFRAGGTESKVLRFHPDGSIRQSPNKNEHSWKLCDDDTLEIYREDGSVQNRFDWLDAEGRFESSNMRDIKAQHGQWLERA